MAHADAEVVLFFGGDTSHGESYQDAYELESGHSVLRDRPYAAAFDRLTPLMSDVDLLFLNLETPLTHRRVSPIKGKPSYLYSNPDKAPASLKRLGVDVVSIANNHALDYGPAGLDDTLAALAEAGIGSFGAGKDLTAAERAFVSDLSDGDGKTTVALVGAFERRDWYEPFDFYATPDRPGVNAIDLPRLRTQISKLKRREPAPFVIVTPHWGENYVWRTTRLRETAEAMIEAGADMVIGHGAHRLQEIDLIQGRWVFYSIGNFVFNSDGAFTERRSTPYSLPVRVSLQRTPSGYRVGVRGYPIHADNLATDYQPRPVSLSEFNDVRQLLMAYDSSGSLSEHAVWGHDERGYCVALGTGRDGVEPLAALPTQEALIQPGEGRITFDADGEPPLDVWTYLPKEHRADGPVLIVMHGTLRNADEYRNDWIQHADRLGALLLVPEFSKADYPSGYGYHQLNVVGRTGTPMPITAWGPQRVEALFEYVTKRMELTTGAYYLYGHSAGGQFVHRAMMVLPDTRARLAIAANSGWYTLPQLETPYPEGLAGSTVDAARLCAALQRRVVVHLGTGDNDPDDPYLPRGEAAMRQGPHRYARGLAFFDKLEQTAAQLDVRLNWRVERAADIVHSNAAMAPHAARLIEADLASVHEAVNTNDIAPREVP